MKCIFEPHPIDEEPFRHRVPKLLLIALPGPAAPFEDVLVVAYVLCDQILGCWGDFGVTTHVPLATTVQPLSPSAEQFCFTMLSHCDVLP